MKSIEVFGRTYHVDLNGNVFKTSGKVMSRHSGREYPYVEFRKKENGKTLRKRFFCHRLVAELYIPNPDGLPQVNHIDGNKENSCVSNLEWVTDSENQIHSRYVLHNKTGFTDRPVMCVETNKKYKSTRDAWRDTGVSYSHISECARGKRNTAGGYRWRYVCSIMET